MFEKLNETANHFIEEVEAKKEADRIIPKNVPFIANNWLKEGVENDTLKEIKSRGGAVVRAHPIWPPRAFAFGQLTHQHLATARMLYLAS